MQRQIASNFLRETLDNNGLKDWHIRLTADMTKPFLGMCSYKDKCIILNTFHIDTHPDVEVINTIRHEVAHALCPYEQHNSKWADKARELGCDNTQPCASYSFSPAAIDAIRSGAELTVEFDERTEVIRTPKYTITKLQEKCPTCGKVAKEKSHSEVKTSKGRKIVIQLECNHWIFKDAESTSNFEDLTFDGSPNCKHNWNKTICVLCGAKKLYPFQVLGARAIERANGRFAIFDEMGLGKTIQALAYLKYHLHDALPYLWVTKSGIKYQHAKEIVRVLGKEHFPQIFTRGKEKPIKGMSGYLIGYDMFRRLDLSMFDDLGIQTVILDECQAIKNPDSSRTQAIRAVVRDIPRIIPLSGTPWKNRGSEFYVALNLLDPTLFYSFQDFKDRWVQEYWDGSRRKEGGIRKPEKFKELTKHIMVRRERTEVMPELPLVNRTRLLCEVPDWARNAYNKEKAKLTQIYNDSLLEGEETNTFENARKMNEILMVMKQIVGIAKVPATVEFVQEFLEDTDRKMIVFVHHKEVGKQILEQLAGWCNENHLAQPLKISSDMDSQLRFEVQEKFNSNSHRLLIASTLASGEGLNLQTCSDMVMHERQWNASNEEQAEGRMIRIGQQSQSINATYVHGDNTIDTILDGIVESKRLAFHQAMNKGAFPVWNQESMMSEVIKQVVMQRD